MKRILAIAVALALPTAALAQLYKSVDKDGRVTYSDQPPPAQESKQLSIPTASGAAPPRSPLDRDKEQEKTRAEAAKKAKAADDADKRAKIDAENCSRARANLRIVTDGGRIATFDAKGERNYLDDAQLEEERLKARKAVDEYCKSS